MTEEVEMATFRKLAGRVMGYAIMKNPENFSYGIPNECVYTYREVIRETLPVMTISPLYDAIRRYAARLLKNLDAGEDIAQEVFLRLEQQQDTVTQPQAWAYRTARNLVIDQFRRSRPTESLPDDLPADATRFDPGILAEKQEIQTMVQQKINDLSPRHREVLRLKFQEGLKYAEIAEVIGESVNTVAWLLHEAIAMLRKELAV